MASGAEIDFHDPVNRLQLVNFSSYPTDAVECLLAKMPNKGPGNLPFLPPHVLSEGPHGQTDWSRLPGVENIAPPQGRGFRETPYMSSLGAALFDQIFWECIQHTSVQDFIHHGSSDRAKHGFVSFILDKAGCGRPSNQNRWIGWNYFQYGSDGRSGPDVRPTNYVYKFQFVPNTFRVGSVRFPRGATSVPNTDRSSMDGEFIFDIRNDDTFWNFCMQFRTFYLPTIVFGQWGVDLKMAGPGGSRGNRPASYLGEDDAWQLAQQNMLAQAFSRAPITQSDIALAAKEGHIPPQRVRDLQGQDRTKRLLGDSLASKASGVPADVRLKRLLGELDYVNIQEDSELFKAILLGTLNADAQSEEIRDMSEAFKAAGEAFFTDNIRNNAPTLSNKIPGKVIKLMQGAWSAFSDDTLDLARCVISPKDSHKEPTAAPITEWAGFLLMLQTAVKIMIWLQWPQYPSKNIPKGQPGYGQVEFDDTKSFLTVMTAKCTKLKDVHKCVAYADMSRDLLKPAMAKYANLLSSVGGFFPTKGAGAMPSIVDLIIFDTSDAITGSHLSQQEKVYALDIATAFESFKNIHGVQNQALQLQVNAQQAVIDSLLHQVTSINRSPAGKGAGGAGGGAGGGNSGGAPEISKSAARKERKRLREAEAKAGAGTAMVTLDSNKREKLPPHVIHSKVRDEYYRILSAKHLILKGAKRCHPHDISLVDGYGAYGILCDCSIRSNQFHAGAEFTDPSGTKKVQTNPPLEELGALLTKWGIPKTPKIGL